MHTKIDRGKALHHQVITPGVPNPNYLACSIHISCKHNISDKPCFLPLVFVLLVPFSQLSVALLCILYGVLLVCHLLFQFLSFLSLLVDVSLVCLLSVVCFPFINVCVILPPSGPATSS